LAAVPGVVPLELALARSDRFAVFVTYLAAYPEGFEFDVLAVAAPGQDVEDLPDPMLFGVRVPTFADGAERSPTTFF
jgi:hypothetical protein